MSIIVKTIFTVLAVLLLSSCKSGNEKRFGNGVAQVVNAGICIKTPSLYNAIFLKGLSGYKDSLAVIDNFIVAGIDTIYFPESLPINRTINFKGNCDSFQIELDIKRIGLTDIAYTLTITGQNGVHQRNEGKAILGSMFFLGSEIDEDDSTGEAYGSSEYFENDSACITSIRISSTTDSSGTLKALVTSRCNNIHLKDCPTLRAKTK